MVLSGGKVTLLLGSGSIQINGNSEQGDYITGAYVKK